MNKLTIGVLASLVFDGLILWGYAYLMLKMGKATVERDNKSHV
jgi:hypothetical protein